MGKNHYIFLPFFLLLLASQLQETISVKYIITNNARHLPGGRKFDREIGVPYALLTMSRINNFIWKLFEQNSISQRKNVPVLNVYISDFTGNLGIMAYASGDNINISAQTIQSYGPGQSKFGFASLMYHEMTHVFQWTGEWTAPSGIIEGMADYVMVKSKYYLPKYYAKPGTGSRWDQGYGVTERFLEYCDGLKKGFTVQLNKKMRYRYSDNYFVELLGKPVGQLWKEYKAKYGNIPAAKDEMPQMLKQY